MALLRRFPVLLLLPIAAACASAVHQATDPAPDHQHHAAHGAMPAEVDIPPGVIYTAADVHFMQGMIAHHAQAIHMSRLAEERGLDSRLLRFARKIDQSQAAEILLMQGWLADRDQVVPDTSSYRTMMMQGMLTPEELASLAAARGTAFDRLFLELMIRHHEGALAMVADLLATPRAAQDVDVNVFANEIHLVQTAEIDVMHQMLSDLQGAPQ